ncbi:hypothetical protein V5O48_003354 [Marasmius crinis-equi]|uniref:F-box domain-containing protein n=1 Tax=Marasmius crinis-equi TaxID=585013 RepID=A0ABR3FTK5_9AGAR
MTNCCEKCSFAVFDIASRHMPISRDKLRSEYTITSTKLVEVLSHIADEEQDMERYDAEIARVKGILARLEEKRSALKQKILGRRSYVSAMRRVPSELWVEVFEHHIAQTIPQTWQEMPASDDEFDGFEYEEEWRAALEAPFKLSRVCKHRSKAQELSVFVRDTGSSPSLMIEEEIVADGGDAFQMLMNHTPRIRRLLMFDLDFPSVERPLDPRLSQLNCLRLVHSVYPPWFQEAVRKAPLDSVVIEHGEPTPFETISSNLTLRTLDILDLAGSAGPLLNSLPTLPNLDSLIIQRFRGHIVPQPPIKSDSLRHLRIHHGDGNPSGFLRSLDLPNLQRFELHLPETAIRLSHLLFPLSSFSSLQQLFLGFRYPSFLINSRLEVIFRALPNLATLGISLFYDVIGIYPDRDTQSRLEADLCSFFSQLEKTPTLGSRLESLFLTVTWTPMTTAMVEALTLMLETRARSKHTLLREVNLSGQFSRRRLASELVARLRAVHAKGIKCVITDPRFGKTYFHPNRLIPDMTNCCEKCSFAVFDVASRHAPLPRDEFRSEYTIPSTKMVEILSHIADEEEDMERYDAEIARVKGILATLEEKRTALNSKILRRRSYISALRRVPSELWAEVFEYHIAQTLPSTTQVMLPGEDDPEGSEYDKEWHAALQAPFRLSHVCKRWRDIANSTPRLWSTIFLNLRWRHANRALGLYLDRSKTQDLSVLVRDTKYGSSKRRSIEGQIAADGAHAFRMLMDHMSRFRRLLMFDLDFPPMHRPLEPTLSRLDSLRVVHSEHPSWFQEAVRKAPLDSVVIEHGEPTLFEMISSSSTLKILHILEMDEVAVPLLELLPTLPILDSLFIQRFYGHIEPQPPKKSDTLRYLRIDYRDRDPCGFLQSLDLPNLKRLELHLPEADIGLGNLLPYLPAFSSLRQIFIGFRYPSFLENSRLVDIFQSLPNIGTVGISIFYVDTVMEPDRDVQVELEADVCSFFSKLEKTPTLGTRLESILLTVTWAPTTTAMIKALTRMLEARARTRNSSLTDFHLVGEFSRRLPPGLVARLRAVHTKGIKCVVTDMHDKTYFHPNRVGIGH